MPWVLSIDQTGGPGVRAVCRVRKRGTRKYYSKRKMPCSRAKRQMRALYAATGRHKNR